MNYVDWEIKGPEISSCSCDWGCPCQFNSLPTHGNCRAAMAFEIEQGHFGEVSLDGLRAAAMVAWPGPIHEGGGECQPIVDERASAAQRAALLTIMSGGETAPGATLFSVFAATYAKVHEPVFAPILFAVDFDEGRGTFSVPGLVNSSAGPIANPLTGQIHRATVRLAQSFEFVEAEFVDSKVHGEAPIVLDWERGHGHLTVLHMNAHGLLR
ncbi:MAG: DUF1326 domain-containing protein [Gammaproteobacteria bacterium]|nr:DUF1326 domain-containing protein [Gammaproteobacteria bacterium]MBP6051341.1 DUF1326 domain-containing protein [Pseudomonadales bacterium]MBK7519015.1 DUF1326 domain-containing protein [Gammaproteobacteria bacterium]MBK7730244.1 DUF1326 domain-containing protein [Gammaproteobacteria bacterium]MBK8306060.1 DUF1326 domain-containing protein [Gammaproteobacteria bacterium]